MRKFTTLFFIFFFTIIGYFVYVTKGPLTRSLTNIENERVRIGVKELNDKVKFFVVGIEEDRPDFLPYNAHELGFEALEGPIDKMTPKFLFLFHGDILHKVYAFELAKGSTRALEAKETSSIQSRFYVNVKHFGNKNWLPIELVNVQKSKGQRIKRTLMKWAISALGFTQFAPLAVALQRLLISKVDNKMFQSSYLERMIKLALFENKLSRFKEIIGEENLYQLGSGLNMLYRQVFDLNAFFVNDDNRVELYKLYENKREMSSSINMSRLIQRSNEEGLVVIPFSNDFAFLFYDPNNHIDKDLYSDFLLDTSKKDIASIQEQFKSLEIDRGKLVPIGVFSTNRGITANKVLNFVNSQSILNRENFNTLLDDVKQIGLNFIPIPFLDIALETALNITAFISVKQGSTALNMRIQNEAELAVLLETGVVKMDVENIALNAFVEQMEELGMDKKTIDVYKGKLASEDPNVSSQAVNEIIQYFNRKQTDKRFYSSLKLKEMEANKLINWKRLKRFLTDDKDINRLVKKVEKFFKKRARKVASEEEITPSKFRADRPAIVFLMDGMRPDRFREAAALGHMPNLKKLFIENGIELKSYTSRSLTLPSWGTILTGYDPDSHGVRSNSPINRNKGETSENFTDYRKDFTRFKNLIAGRSYRQLTATGIKWLPSYYEDDEVILNYMPYNEDVELPLKHVAKRVVKSLNKIMHSAFTGAVGLDLASMDAAIEKMKKHPGRHKLVMNWYASVDYMSHHNNHNLEYLYKAFDEKLGELIETAKKDPVLKDAIYYLVSDHGMMGGFESEHSHYKLKKHGHHYNNTAFNLSKFFAGDFNSHNDYNFVIKAFESPNPKHDLAFLQEFMIHPYDYTYRGKRKKNRGDHSIMVDYSGDALAQIYVKHPQNGWKERVTWHQLTNYPLNEGKGKINFIDDLLSIRLRNMQVVDQDVRKALTDIHDSRPVRFFIMPLVGEKVKRTIEERHDLDYKLSRPPVFLKSYPNKTALLLTTRHPTGVEIFSYYVVKDFYQDEAGNVSYSLTNDSSFDPLGYLNVLGLNPTEWKTDRKWLTLLQDHEYPTAAFAMVRAATISRNLKTLDDRKGEVADFILTSNYGFNFNSSYTTEGDHGSFEKVQVRNTMFIGSFSPEVREELEPHDGKLFLNRQFTPTLLDLSGMKKDSDLWDPQWKSFR